jgi:hypothetical protein
MRQPWILFLLLVSFPSLCPAQNPGTVVTIEHAPLPIIINGRSGSQPKPVDEKALLGGTTKGTSTPASVGKEEDPTTVVETLRSFTPENLQLTWSLAGWQLKADEVVLKDFGRNESLGRQILLLVRELRLNQYGMVGQPKPVLEYWLSDGKAAQGIPTGLRVVSLDQGTLHVEQVSGQWCVRDAYRMLLNFERDEDNARRALAVLKKHRFTQVGTLGAFPPTLIFLSRPGDLAPEVRFSTWAPATPTIQPAGAVLSTMAPSLSASPPPPRIINGPIVQSGPQKPGIGR